MANDNDLTHRSYCTKCDSYRPFEMFSYPSDSWCNPCRTANLQRYTRNLHDRAIFALGGQCNECGLPYDPDNRTQTRLNMMRLPGFDYWMGPKHVSSQYARDKKIINEPEIAKKYIKMLCRKCKPNFVSIT